MTELPVSDLASAIILGAVFGYSNKMADLMNEHGLYWFRGGDLLFGGIFALSGALLILRDPALATYYTALALSWFLLLKLDYRNHAIAGVVMVLTGLHQAGQGRLQVTAVAVIAVGMVLYRLVRDQVKLRRPELTSLFRLRPDIYLFALGWSMASSSVLPFVATVSGMVFVEMVTRYYAGRPGILA